MSDYGQSLRDGLWLRRRDLGLEEGLSNADIAELEFKEMEQRKKEVKKRMGKKEFGVYWKKRNGQVKNK